MFITLSVVFIDAGMEEPSGIIQFVDGVWMVYG